MRVLAVSPHLDDAVFSAGGTLARLAAAGHDVVVATVFTRSVPAPTGFALACQTDKGLAADVDYMELRRAEDRAALAVLGAVGLHLDLPEAPHRGYDSAPDLFAGVHDGEEVWARAVEVLEPLDADVWLGPQGLGSHVDHLQVVRALQRLGRPTAWWRDSPYLLRDPRARHALTGPLAELALSQDLALRADACACYTTQLGFQFGSEASMRAALSAVPEVLLADPVAADLLSGLASPDG